MQGPLEQTNEGYALAKISGLRLAQYLKQSTGMQCICPMPCNLYGKTIILIKIIHMFSLL